MLRVALAFSLCALLGAPLLAKRPPNLVLIFADDLGYGDLSCYGHPTIRTPALDRMAREGVRFTQFYSASPACTASRYALLTGKLPPRSGFGWVLVPKSKRGLHEEETTIAELLQARGYRTAIYGKWHLGTGERFSPLRHGFDEYFGLPYSNDMRPPKWPSLPLMEGDAVSEMDPDQNTLTERYTQRALAFVRANRERPFFLYLAHAMPHLPLHASEAFRGRSTRGLYGDVVEELDASTGRILAEIEKLGLRENTLVLFLSDNGPWIIKGERGGSAGLLRDGKGSTWEGGVRIPAIAWGGPVAAKKPEPAVMSTLDVLPSFAELAGSAFPEELDGEARSSALTGRGEAAPRGPLFFYGPRHRLHAVRHGVWKLHVHTSSQTRKRYFANTPLLFHLERDPSEQYPLADEEPLQRLQRLLEGHRERMQRLPSYWSD